MTISIISHTSKPSDSVKRLLKALGQKEPTALHYGLGVDKLTQYQYFKDNGLPHPEWTTDANVAKSWVQAGQIVFARSKIKGQTGSGITIIETLDDWPNEEIKVWTQYIKKKREFRVNCFQGKVVNLREKLKQIGSVGSSYIRNKANGYTTAHCKPMSTELDIRLRTLAEKACGASQSDFIGVDIGYNEFKDFLFLLEVNSGPSIEGSSVKDYVEAITK